MKQSLSAPISSYGVLPVKRSLDGEGIKIKILPPRVEGRTTQPNFEFSRNSEKL